MKQTHPQQALILLAAQATPCSNDVIENFNHIVKQQQLGQQIVIVGDSHYIPTPLLNDKNWLMLYNPRYIQTMVTSIQYGILALEPHIKSVLIYRLDQLEETQSFLVKLLSFQKNNLTQMLHLGQPHIFPISIPSHDFDFWIQLNPNEAIAFHSILQEFSSCALI